MFYFIASLMVLVALAFVLVPIFLSAKRAKRVSLDDQTPSIGEANLDAFRQQKREIEAEYASGLITQSAHAAALDELTTRAASEIGADTKVEQVGAVSANNGSKSTPIIGFVISAFIVAGTIVGYVSWGHPEGLQIASAAKSAETPIDPDKPMTDKQIVALVDNLAKKMQENPDDVKGWILLARTQQALGQLGASTDAFQRAVALTPNDAQLLADYADAQAMVQEGVFDGKPRALMQQALKIDPNNLKALALSGTAEMRAGNKTASLKYWEKLKSLVPPDSEDYKQVSAIIGEIKTGKPAFAETGAQPAAPAAAAPPVAPVANAAPAGATGSKSVSGLIDIDSAIKANLSPSDTLFIFARAATKGAPKMPLAVLRVPAPKNWPYAYTLSDAMAMAPGMNLSSFTEVTIEARLSKSGNALPQPGDLQGGVSPVKNDAKGVNLTINKVLP